MTDRTTQRVVAVSWVFSFMVFQGSLASRYRLASWAMDMALEQADYSGWQAKQQSQDPREPLIGIGVATVVKASGGVGPGRTSHARIVVEPTGQVNVYTEVSPHGQGTETFADGSKYVGEFKDDKKHGQGTYTYPDGEVKEGIFENDKFLYARKTSPTVTATTKECPSSPSSSWTTIGNWTDCFGIHNLPNGDKYVGEYRDDKRHGQGTTTYVDGRVEDFAREYNIISGKFISQPSGFVSKR